VAERTPRVLVGGPGSEWPALRRWGDSSYLEERLGVLDSVYHNTAPTFVWENPDREMGVRLGVGARAPHTLRDAVPARDLFSGITSCANASGSAVEYLYSTLQLPPSLAGDAPISGMGLAEHHPVARGVQTNLWLGGCGSTAHPHFDVSHNFHVQVVGRKTFELWPPWARLHMYPFAHPADRQSMIGDVVDNATAFANSGGQVYLPTPVVVKLAPGEMLYIPPFWAHRVTAGQSLTASVSIWWDSPEGDWFNAACRVGLPPGLMRSQPGSQHRIESLVLYVHALAKALGAQDGASARDLVRHYLYDDRYSLIEADLRCKDVPMNWQDVCSPGAKHAQPPSLSPPNWPGRDVANEASSDAWAHYAQQVIRALGPEGTTAQTDAPPGKVMASGSPSHRNTTIEHYVAVRRTLLIDYMEHVAGYAVGVARVCAFFRVCGGLHLPEEKPAGLPT